MTVVPPFTRLPFVLLLLLISSTLLFYSKRKEGWLSPSYFPDGQRRQLNLRESLGHFHRLFTDAQARENAIEINEWRSEFKTKCETSKVTSEEMKSTLRDAFKPSRVKRGTHEDSLPVEPCQHTFLDLGSSVGESLGKLIDAGLPACYSKQLNPSRYDLNTGYVGKVFYGPIKNPLVAWISSVLQKVNRYPESYCYFGIEGNHAFSDQLRQLERQVMRSHPRPVRRAHYFTDSVVAEKDGPITLYLDTINTQQNFWGSSLLPTHRDVESSIRMKNTTSQAQVEGYTLTALLEHTVIRQEGAHVIIKMDVEGAEYEVFQEAVPKLCNFTNSGVRVDLLIAIHDTQVLGDADGKISAMMDAYNLNKIKAVECGVNLFEGDYAQ